MAAAAGTKGAGRRYRSAAIRDWARGGAFGPAAPFADRRDRHDGRCGGGGARSYHPDWLGPKRGRRSAPRPAQGKDEQQVDGQCGESGFEPVAMAFSIAVIFAPWQPLRFPLTQWLRPDNARLPPRRRAPGRGRSGRDSLRPRPGKALCLLFRFLSGRRLSSSLRTGAPIGSSSVGSAPTSSCSFLGRAFARATVRA